MRITYSEHAVLRMSKRVVSKSEVEHVLRHGSPSVRGGVEAKKAVVNGRAIRVPYRKTGPKPWTFHVISVIEE